MPVTWSDEKLILLYFPAPGSNSPPSARSFKHGQCVPRPSPLGHSILIKVVEEFLKDDYITRVCNFVPRCPEHYYDNIWIWIQRTIFLNVDYFISHATCFGTRNKSVCLLSHFGIHVGITLWDKLALRRIQAFDHYFLKFVSSTLSTTYDIETTVWPKLHSHRVLLICAQHD